MRSVFLLCCLLAAVACTKDSLEQPSASGARIVGSPALEYALQGVLSVQLTAEMAQAVARAQGETAATRGAAPTRSGVESIDNLLAEIGADRFRRVVDYNPDWESIYDRTGMNRWYRISFDPETDLARVGQRFAGLEGVSVVEYEVHPRHIRPMCTGPAVPAQAGLLPERAQTRASLLMNDPLLAGQWHFENNGADQYFSTPRAGADIDLVDAWNLCTGSEEIIVAVIDEPVQTTHPDLKANIWSNPSNPDEHGYNFWDDKAELDWRTATQEDGQWVYADHGTHVAGVIAAVNNNSRGVCGIAGGRSGRGGVKIMSCQIMGYSNGDTSDNPIVKAFEYAWTHGAIIAQNSWGYDFSDASASEAASDWTRNYGIIRTAIDTFITGAGSQNANSPLDGGLVIFAAGNDGDRIGDVKTYPASYGPVIAVGAMDWAFRPSYYTDYGTWVDITAPGGDLYVEPAGSRSYYIGAEVLSTILCDDEMNFQDKRKDDALYGYGFMQGTSMACPHVSGVAALGLSYAAQLGRKYSVEEFKAMLLSSVYGIDDYFTGTKEGITVPSLTAYRGKMGGGCVDALKLLLAVRGTPAVWVPTGQTTEIDFAPFFGGDRSAVELQSATLESPEQLGLTVKQLAITGSRISFRCPKSGVSVLRIRAMAGDTSLTREFALVSRAGLAGNGGWL